MTLDYYDNFVQYPKQFDNHVLPLQLLVYDLAVTYPAEIAFPKTPPEKTP